MDYIDYKEKQRLIVEYRQIKSDLAKADNWFGTMMGEWRRIINEMPTIWIIEGFPPLGNEEIVFAGTYEECEKFVEDSPYHFKDETPGRDKYPEGGRWGIFHDDNPICIGNLKKVHLAHELWSHAVAAKAKRNE